MMKYEDLVIEKLKVLGPATRREWSEALGYNSPQAFWNVLQRLVKSGDVIENRKVRPFTYEVKP